MTAWCSSTTSVRKVRARSSEGLRVLAFGAAVVSADVTVVEIVVISAPRQGSHFSLRCCRREPDSARPNLTGPGAPNTSVPRTIDSGLPAEDPAHPEGRPIVDFGRGALRGPVGSQ